ncbi:MAG TPA: hypothetical protein VN836_05655 [Verrucomicrobiae bacterium]|nr:hypothetical protein [Verrucomicrobiae bacterium]
MKWLFKWLFRLFLLAVVLVVILLLSLNSILRAVMEHRIRAQTGMDAEIGKVSVGFVEPTVEIQNLRIYNSTNFGGTPFLNIPEIHVEYDRAALARHEIHITLIRFNLGELDIVKNEAGQTNIFALGLPASTRTPKAGSAAAELKKQTGYDFRSIDVLNVSIGKVRFIDLKDQRNNREQTIGIEDLPVKNVKSGTDLAGLAVLVGLRGGDFFKSVFGPQNQNSGVLQLLWH